MVEISEKVIMSEIVVTSERVEISEVVERQTLRDRHEKRSRCSDTLQRFLPIIESLAAVISHICGNECSRNHLWIIITVSLKQIPTK